MWPDRVLNPRPLIYESGALLTVLHGPALYSSSDINVLVKKFWMHRMGGLLTTSFLFRV